MKKIIEQEIISDFAKNTNPEHNWDRMIPGIGEYDENRILVDHYLMNFVPAINKIKIDLMMNRKDKDGKEPPLHLVRYF
jgi:hypothetical protein